MLKVIIRLGLFICVLSLFVTTCEGSNNREAIYVSPYEGLGSINYPEDDEWETTRKGLGISAWGIVAVVVFIILAIMGMYFFSICYPVLFQKQRKSDMTGLVV